MYKYIEKVVPKSLKTKIKELVFKVNLSIKMNKVRKKNGYCIIFISTPIHGNLGDQAIVYSQYKFFEKLGLNEQIIEIRSCDYKRFYNVIEEKVNEKDIIIIDGGGNMGTLWIEEEYKMRDIVTRFKNNKVMIFPQTVYYSNDEFGKLELRKSIEIYTAHNNLHICARDSSSYEFVKKEYSSINVQYTPDIVLYINDLHIKNQRNGATLCIRKDKEKGINNNVLEKIESIIRSKNLVIKYSSTVIDKSINKNDREIELLKKWNEFASTEIIVTDRLHGMIFAAITSTPCIALNNSNGKVEGVYEWIKSLPYIKFCKNIDSIEQDIETLLNTNNNMYDNSILEEGFERITNMIKM